MQPVPHNKMQACRIASEVVAVGKPVAVTICLHAKVQIQLIRTSTTACGFMKGQAVDL